MNDNTSLKIAIPNKGALSEGAVKLLLAAGYRCGRSGSKNRYQSGESEHAEGVQL